MTIHQKGNVLQSRPSHIGYKNAAQILFRYRAFIIAVKRMQGNLADILHTDVFYTTQYILCAIQHKM